MTLGIDLGTSNTVAASLSKDGNPVLIPDVLNKSAQSTPSVALIEDNRAYAGELAESLFDQLPDKQLIAYFKRNFGTSEPVYFDTNKTPWFSETVASLLLRKIQYDASMYLPDGYSKTVITVPAHYNDIQRKSVMEAARLAGVDLTAIIEEPIAAALYYSSITPKIDDEIILVYDFGGGTFDLTLVTKSGYSVNVIAKDGVNQLGGREFDSIILDTIHRQYESAFGSAFPADRHTANRMKKISEQLKIEMNGIPRRKVLSKWIMAGREGFELSLRYDEYEKKALQLIARTETAVNRCLRSLGMSFGDIHKMILTGGSSNSRLVFEFWKARISDRQQLIYHQPLSSVAKGAALYAASLSNGSQSHPITPIDLVGVSTYNIGILREDDPARRMELLVHRNTPLPVSARKVYPISAVSNHRYSFQVYQFWNLDEERHLLGTACIDLPSLQGAFNLEVIIDHRADGTIGLKLRNADNGRDIKFEFQKPESAHKYDFHQQKRLVDNIYLNSMI